MLIILTYVPFHNDSCKAHELLDSIQGIDATVQNRTRVSLGLYLLSEMYMLYIFHEIPTYVYTYSIKERPF